MENTTEDTTLPAEQSKTQIAEIAKASILNIEQNKKAYEELRDEATGIVLPEFKDPEFKKTHKKVTELSGRLVKARTAADKLVKQELAIVDEVKTMIKSAGEDLKSITADAEKEIKRLKDAAEQLIEDDKAETLRKIEEAKQARIAKLYELGFKIVNGYYELGELTITAIQIVQYTEAQFEGLVSQATAAYEAEQLRLAEEAQKEADRLAQEQRDREAAQAVEQKEKEALRVANEAKQAELDAARREQDIMRIEIAESRVDLLKSKGFGGDLKLGHMFYGTAYKVKAAKIVDSNRAEWAEVVKGVDVFLEELKKPKEPVKDDAPIGIPMSGFESLTTTVRLPKNGTPIKFTEEQRDSILHDVLVGEEAVKGDFEEHTATLVFDTNNPYIDTPVGKSTLRIYVEQFLDAAQDCLTPDMVAATGGIGDELLFMVIKPAK
jgi:regulator of replication initiation timing